jgi:hypothetical protein
MINGKNTPQKPGCDDVNEASLRIRLLGEAELLMGGIAEIRHGVSPAKNQYRLMRYKSLVSY